MDIIQSRHFAPHFHLYVDYVMYLVSGYEERLFTLLLKQLCHIKFYHFLMKCCRLKAVACWNHTHGNYVKPSLFLLCEIKKSWTGANKKTSVIHCPDSEMSLHLSCSKKGRQTLRRQIIMAVIVKVTVYITKCVVLDGCKNL